MEPNRRWLRRGLAAVVVLLLGAACVPAVTPTPTEEVTGTPEATPPEGVSPTPTLPEGPGAPTGTEVVISFVLVLALLAAVGVVVYVLPAGAI